MFSICSYVVTIFSKSGSRTIIINLYWLVNFSMNLANLYEHFEQLYGWLRTLKRTFIMPSVYILNSVNHIITAAYSVQIYNLAKEAKPHLATNTDFHNQETHNTNKRQRYTHEDFCMCRKIVNCYLGSLNLKRSSISDNIYIGHKRSSHKLIFLMCS